MSKIDIRNLNKTFYNKFGQVVSGLQDINLSVETGEIVAIIGTNGAGKSTFMNCISGQFPIDSGSVFFDGDRVDQLGQIKLAKFIGRVFQDPNMGTAPRMTVFENLILASKRGELRGLKQSLTDQAYKDLQDYLATFQLDLENRLDLPIELLSGGQRQIVSLIMATLKHPKLLILDEHTAALDPRTAKKVMKMSYDMIRKLKITTLMITHHLQDAIDYSDRIIVMHQGQIVREINQSQKQTITSADLYKILEEIMDS